MIPHPGSTAFGLRGTALAPQRLFGLALERASAPARLERAGYQSEGEDQLHVYDAQVASRFTTFSGAFLCGAHSEYFVIDAAAQYSVMGVHFKPGCAFPFLGLTAGELQNTHVSLETLWGRSAVVLRERLLEAKPEGDRLGGGRLSDIGGVEKVPRYPHVGVTITRDAA
jgi:hypothetical protein